MPAKVTLFGHNKKTTAIDHFSKRKKSSISFNKLCFKKPLRHNDKKKQIPVTGDGFSGEEIKKFFDSIIDNKQLRKKVRCEVDPETKTQCFLIRKREYIYESWNLFIKEFNIIPPEELNINVLTFQRLTTSDPSTAKIFVTCFGYTAEEICNFLTIFIRDKKTNLECKIIDNKCYLITSNKKEHFYEWWLNKKKELKKLQQSLTPIQEIPFDADIKQPDYIMPDDDLLFWQIEANGEESDYIMSNNNHLLFQQKQPVIAEDSDDINDFLNFTK